MRFQKARPAGAPLDREKVGLRLCKVTMDVRISEVDIAEPEPFHPEMHPRCNGKPMSDHVAGHHKQQDEHDEDRTGLGRSGKRREAALDRSGGERDGTF